MYVRVITSNVFVMDVFVITSNAMYLWCMYMLLQVI